MVFPSKELLGKYMTLKDCMQSVSSADYTSRMAGMKSVERSIGERHECYFKKRPMLASSKYPAHTLQGEITIVAREECVAGRQKKGCVDLVTDYLHLPSCVVFLLLVGSLVASSTTRCSRGCSSSFHLTKKFGRSFFICGHIFPSFHHSLHPSVSLSPLLCSSPLRRLPPDSSL